MLFLTFFALSFCYKPSIIPQPVELTVIDGQWTLTSTCQIGYDPSNSYAKEVAQFAADELKQSTGFSLPVVSQRVSSGIYFGKSDSLQKESEYQVIMDQSVVEIYSTTRSGLFYGYKSLLQLLPKEIYSQTKVTNIEWTAPCVTIYDYPRFSWRGAMIDSARHFFDVDTVKSFINCASNYKLNVIHIHLTEDQGWRLEIKKYPKITEIGSVRDSSPMKWNRNKSDGVVYGPFYYTEDEMRDIIEYARLREVTIVPEIEMPGHSLAILSAYPEYSCTGGPFKPRTKWGIEDDVWCAGNDEAIAFLEDILDEVLKIFPSKYIHVGGDECPKSRWNKCSKCQQRIKDLGLKNADELESWFIEHFAQFLDSRGRYCIGWDEIMNGKLPDGAAIMSWTGTEAGEKAAEEGHNVVFTPTSYCYLDYYQFPADDAYEYIGGPVLTVNHVYSYDPSSGVSDDHKHFVIGSQGNLWSEYIWEKEDLDFKAFPRLLALAEVVWTPLEKKDWSRFLGSLGESNMDKLEQMGMNPSPIQLGQRMQWFNGDFPENKWISVSWPTTGTAGSSIGSYQAAFIHTSGHPLKIRNVHLRYASVSVASDSHEGVASEEPENNLYDLYTIFPYLFGEVDVTAEVYCDGGSDCEGEVFLYYT
ncbi:Beta-hexosaminidase [Tritrichomonas foetus]|uniref:beta-N-acetylhexosaminidase n=1 Tax=Tritrichomonas foetus TaxID=1144522 RepID=A0A1J4KHG5_9EUKA|nr:Beta-hexosaminidase [Tritrichomonas foetus]|eukprot:OHT10474.1 Beta-hexosaminidase [Tritrichomonas foetus]